jgi:hypothetical protein
MKMVLGVFWTMAVLGLLGILVLQSDPKYKAQKEQAEPSPHAQNAESQSAEPEKSGGEGSSWSKYKEKIERNEKFITATSTIFIAGFTIALAFATFFLWLATRDLVEDAKHNAGRQLRAYINVSGVNILDMNALFGKRDFEIAVEAKNFGQTPAYDYSNIGGAVVSIPENPTLPAIEGSRSDSVISPAVVVGKFIHVPPLTDAEIQGLRDRSMSLFAFGRIEYKDAFGYRRFTTYKYRIGGQDGWRANGAMAYSSDGNHAN